MHGTIRKLFATQQAIAWKARALVARTGRERAVMIAQDLQQCAVNPITRYYWQRVESTLDRQAL